MQRVILTRKLTPEKLILYPFFPYCSPPFYLALHSVAILPILGFLEEDSKAAKSVEMFSYTTSRLNFSFFSSFLPYWFCTFLWASPHSASCLMLLEYNGGIKDYTIDSTRRLSSSSRSHILSLLTFIIFLFAFFLFFFYKKTFCPTPKLFLLSFAGFLLINNFSCPPLAR